ncbi:MAG: response regulator [Candidatus Sumerlaeia bacterium]|nr:response regulator [Candidatus Sumerlaeia bacterium]
MTTRTILLVEDNADDEALALRALRRDGLDACVEVARDGAEALEWLNARADATPGPSLPVVVLLDLKLPKVGGIEVLGAIRRHPQMAHLPVVVVTSSRESRDLAACYAERANGFVCKPVEFEAFSEAIRTVVRYWLEYNVPPPVSVGD